MFKNKKYNIYTNNMIVLIPLGGLGTRFKKYGYDLPKPLINVMGKPIIYWLLDNLNLSIIDLVVIPYNKEIAKYRFESRLKKDYPTINFLFIKLQENTDGAAETILMALNQLNIDDKPVLCLDGDNFYLQDIISQWNGDNCVYVFEDNSTEEVFSYVNFDGVKITDIVEKQKISNLASTGGYGFNSWKRLQKYCQEIVDKQIKQKNEYYTSTVIKQMIQNDCKFVIKKVLMDKYICLGTPLHVRIFCNNFPKINALTSTNMLPSKKFCFDLDNTLVTFPTKTNDYTSVKPIEKNISIVRYLKKLGHTIIIYTARRMKTHKGNTGRVLADIGKITFDTLEKFNIPYDEIYFGKPNADFYIDDLAISSFADLEKKLGYYRSNVDPRDFNTISTSSIQTYKKSSNDLSGEIFYYHHIPIEIKDMFPILISWDIDNKWYEMEQVNGIPVSKLYLAEELTEIQLNHIIGSIKRIHNCSVNDLNDVNIYCNYLHKLRKRYENYDYSRFKNSELIYQDISLKLEKYENEKLGNKTLIHGDTVFTNILVNQFGKIKFIDMRGKSGETSTIYGDWLYDWAKLYQSLIGYDEILEDIFIDTNYKNKMINFFENKFLECYSIEDLENLKLITKSLLFSLIPLHDNDKCYKYFDLINKI